MQDVRDLKALQIDALREVANIGAGHAATALSLMTNRRIMISVPRSTSRGWRRSPICSAARRTSWRPC